MRRAGLVGDRVHFRLIEPDQFHVLDGHLEEGPIHWIDQPGSVLQLDVQVDPCGPPGLPDEVADHPDRPVGRHGIQPWVRRELEQPVPELSLRGVCLGLYHGCGALNCGNAMRAAALSIARCLIVASTPRVEAQLPGLQHGVSTTVRPCTEADEGWWARNPTSKRKIPRRSVVASG